MEAEIVLRRDEHGWLALMGPDQGGLATSAQTAEQAMELVVGALGWDDELTLRGPVGSAWADVFGKLRNLFSIKLTHKLGKGWFASMEVLGKGCFGFHGSNPAGALRDLIANLKRDGDMALIESVVARNS